MKISKAERRDKKRSKKNKMIVDSKSVFLIRDIIIKRSEKLKKS